MPTRTTNTPECRALANNIATNLKVRRLAKGLTQAEVADAVGVNLESFSRVERGLSLPSFPTLLALAALYGATPGELLESPTTATARTPPRARIRHNRERPGSGAADENASSPATRNVAWPSADTTMPGSEESFTASESSIPS